jgi:hypothetical protein
MASYTDITGLGRSFDHRLHSNRIALGGGVVAFAVLLVVSIGVDDESIVDAGVASAFAAVGVFLGWAMARELDPDLPSAATWAMALTLGIAVFVAPSALVTGVVLVGTRVVAGTVGATVKVGDVVVLGGIGFLAASMPVLWIVLLTIGLWLWAAPEVGDRRTVAIVTYALGAVAGGGVAAWTIVRGDGYDFSITTTAYALAALAGLAMMVASRPIGVESVVDAGGAVIDARRLQMARVATGSFCMWAAVVAGVDGFWSISPAFAALVIAAIYRVFVHPATPPNAGITS